MNTISKLANISAYFFIGTTFILTIICILGIWGGFDDIIGKSFASMGLIAFACLVVLGVEGAYPKKAVSEQVAQEYVNSIESFVRIRKFSFIVIIVSITMCVFLGLLSIWEVFNDEVFWKTLSTMASIGFYALVTLIVCTKREDVIKGLKIEGAVTSQVAQPQATVPAQPQPQVTQAAPVSPSAPQAY